MEYDGVFFDIGGVLVSLPSVREGYVAFLTDFARQEGIDDVDGLIEAWRSALGEYFSAREEGTYRLARVGYQVAIDEAVGREVPEAEWRPLFEEHSREQLRPEPGAVETVRTLAARELHLGVISDIDTPAAERFLTAFDIRECFDTVTTSEAVGKTKPAPEMFETALSAADVDPGRSLYIGDRYDHDMRGGRAAGFVTVAYGGTAAEQAREDPDDAVDHAVDDLSALVALVDG